MSCDSRDEIGSRALVGMRCPLFRESSSNWIRCESHVPDSETIKIMYKHENRCTAQKQIFCEGCYERCEHYRSWLHMNWQEE